HIVPADASGDHQVAGRLPLVLRIPSIPILGLISPRGTYPRLIAIECPQHEASGSEPGVVCRGPILSSTGGGEYRRYAPAVVETADVVIHATDAQRVVAHHLGKIQVIVKGLDRT